MRGVPGHVKVIAGLVAAWCLRLFVLGSWGLYHAGYTYFDAAYGSVGERLFVTVFNASRWAFGTLTDYATFLGIAALLVRFVARSWVRQGYGDLLERPRRWVLGHRRGVQLLAAVPPLLWLVTRAEVSGFLVEPYRLVNALWALAAAWLLARGARAAVSPIDAEGAPARVEIRDDEIAFDAIAVTRRARGAIEAMAVVSVLAVAAMTALPVDLLWRGETLAGVLAYAALASGAAFAFRRASRIGVGIDGVRVHGTSRERFFGYRDLDEARLRGGATLELLRRGQVVLALQIHGDDAARREAILARVAARIAASRDAAARAELAAARLVEGTSRDEVVRVARGGGDYRAPSLTRDQLWAVVEGSTTDGATRSAAAAALAATLDPAERPRLRVAAAACADPKTRLALEQLAAGDDEPAPGAAKARTIALG